MFLIHNSRRFVSDLISIPKFWASNLTAKFKRNTPYHGKVHQVKGHSQLRYLINKCRTFLNLRLAKLNYKKYYALKSRFLETGRNYRIFSFS